MSHATTFRSRLLGALILLLVCQLSLAQAPLSGHWTLIDDDSDDVLREWQTIVRDKLRRDARRAPSQSPMLQAANPNQQINLPLFLASFKATEINVTDASVTVAQRGNKAVKKRHGRDTIIRDINLNPAATAISLRDAARKPPTMFIGGWEKDALVIETTTDDGLLIEERWFVVKDDDETVLHRQVLLRSSIWGEHQFEQRMEKSGG